jgi:putative ABC transport system permease protein
MPLNHQNSSPLLFFRLAWQFLKSSPGLLLLNALGVSIGIAAILGVQVLNRSALAAFQSTIDVVAGKANLQVCGDGSRFDEKIFPKIKRLKNVTHASPSLEAVIILPDYPGEYLRVVGIDLFSHRPFLSFDFSRSENLQSLTSRQNSETSDWMTDPTGIALSTTLGKKLNLPPGSSLVVLVDGKRKTLTVQKWIPFESDRPQADEHLAFMDIASAQEIFGAVGYLDRIDLIVDQKPSDAIPLIESLLPPNAVVRLPDRRGTQISNMLQGFQLNLLALSLITLIVAAFLLNSTMTTFVIRQRSAIGILRALGCTPKQIQQIILFQAAIIGFIGILAGTGFGLLLARWSLDAMNVAVTSLYLLVHVETLAIDPFTIGWIWLFGFIAVLIAAWKPASEASETPPIQGMLPPLKQRKYFFKSPSWICILIAVLSSYGALHTNAHWLGFVAALAWTLALSTRSRSWMLYAIALLLKLFSKILPQSFELALKNVRTSLHRSAVATTALMTAFSMMVGTSIMIDSFRTTVDYWVNQTVRADVYLTSASNLALNNNEALPAETVQRITYLPGISEFDTYHEMWIEGPSSSGDRGSIKLSSIDFTILEKHQHLAFKSRSALPFQKFRDANHVLVNESFASHYRKRVGDTVLLRSPSGTLPFTIEGIFYDYSTDSGLVLLDCLRYADLWKDPKVYSLALYLKNPSEASQMKAQLQQQFGQESRLAIFSNQDLRSEVMRIFDQTFAITWSLRAIAIAVATIGVFLTLTTLISERSREISIMRSLGMSGRSILTMVTIEGCFLGFMGWIMGCIGGLGLAWLLAFVINKAYFGWTIQWHLDISIFFSALALALLSSLLAGILSGIRAIKMPIITGLKHE